MIIRVRAVVPSLAAQVCTFSLSPLGNNFLHLIMLLAGEKTRRGEVLVGSVNVVKNGNDWGLLSVIFTKDRVIEPISDRSLLGIVYGFCMSFEDASCYFAKI